MKILVRQVLADDHGVVLFNRGSMPDDSGQESRSIWADSIGRQDLDEKPDREIFGAIVDMTAINTWTVN